jgi:uncharacterized protein involved in exopolysaccharide biosynthesis
MAEELRLVTRPAREATPTMRDLLSVLFRQRRLAMFSFAAVFLAIVAYGLIAPPYKSEMKILVQRGREDPIVAPTPSQPQFVREAVTEEELNSEVELLRDDEILRVVVCDLGLSLQSGFWLHPWDNDEERTARAAHRLRKRLTVETLKKTNLIDVSYQSADAAETSRVLRALANAYLARHTQVHRPLGESHFFDGQVVQSRRALQEAEMRLVEFSLDQGVVSAASERDAALRNLSDADADARQSEVAISATSERIRTLESRLSGLPERTVTVVRHSDNADLMGKMKSRLLELELNRAELLAKYEPTHRSVRNVEQEIAETKASIAREQEEPLRDQTTDQNANREWAKAELLKEQVELNTLKAHTVGEEALRNRYQEVASRLGEQAIQQDRLISDLKEAEQQYLLYVNKREEARIGDALDQGGILNVTIAEQPTAPALPQLSPFGFAAVGLLAGVVVSLGAAFANDRLNPAFRTPDEVLAYLGTPVLASLPRKNA